MQHRKDDAEKRNKEGGINIIYLLGYYLAKRGDLQRSPTLDNSYRQHDRSFWFRQRRYGRVGRRSLSPPSLILKRQQPPRTSEAPMKSSFGPDGAIMRFSRRRTSVVLLRSLSQKRSITRRSPYGTLDMPTYHNVVTLRRRIEGSVQPCAE